MVRAAKSTEGVPQRVKALRESATMSQVEFARAVGVVRPVITRVECGKAQSDGLLVKLGNFAALAQRHDDALFFWNHAGIAVDLLPTVLDQASGSYRHPRVGETRKRRMPLRIDRLPREVRDAIIAARDAGQTWTQAADAASAKAGFRLSRTSVQRWHDLRVEQPEKEAAVKNASRREIVSLLNQILAAVKA